MVSSMVALVAFVRQITPDPVDPAIANENEPTLYPVGSTVFYLSVCDNGSSIHSGIVVKSYGDQFIDVAQQPSHLVEHLVPVSSVKYTAAPLFAFRSAAEISRRPQEYLDAIGARFTCQSHMASSYIIYCAFPQLIERSPSPLRTSFGVCTMPLPMLQPGDSVAHAS